MGFSPLGHEMRWLDKMERIVKNGNFLCFHLLDSEIIIMSCMGGCRRNKKATFIQSNRGCRTPSAGSHEKIIGVTGTEPPTSK